MGQDSTDSEIAWKWQYDNECTKGYNTLGAFEFTLLNLGVITDDDVSNIEDTECFDERYSIYRVINI